MACENETTHGGALPAYGDVKRGIKSTPRMSRTEAFLHYAEEHPDEVLDVIEHRTEALIRELEAKQHDAARAVPVTSPGAPALHARGRRNRALLSCRAVRRRSQSAGACCSRSVSGTVRSKRALRAAY